MTPLSSIHRSLEGSAHTELRNTRRALLSPKLYLALSSCSPRSAQVQGSATSSTLGWPAVRCPPLLACTCTASSSCRQGVALSCLPVGSSCTEASVAWDYSKHPTSPADQCQGLLPFPFLLSPGHCLVSCLPLLPLLPPFHSTEEPAGPQSCPSYCLRALVH